MPTICGSELARTRSKLATATRLGTEAEVAEARRDHAAAKNRLRHRTGDCRRTPLRPDQVDRITAILRGGLSA